MLVSQVGMVTNTVCPYALSPGQYYSSLSVDIFKSRTWSACMFDEPQFLPCFVDSGASGEVDPKIQTKGNTLSDSVLQDGGHIFKEVSPLTLF